MVKMIAIHSSRGGTGKSLITSNISAILATRGRNVALLDFDFRAPSLLTMFQAQNSIHRWVNDHIDGKANLEDVMVDVTSRFGTEGRFLVGFANVELDAMREIARKDRKWQMKALKRIMEMKDELADLYDIDTVMVDTSPGIQYSSVNAVVSSDLSMIVSSMDLLDLEGAQRIVKDLYRPFKKESYILINKAIPHRLANEESKDDLIERIRSMFDQPLIAIIPCYCDILLAQRASLFSLDQPGHPFTWALTEVAKRLETS
ncbi:MAG: AAA family ATPase [Candidatus Bathyarchaeota archaeon]|jgi:septum site-determining protein MinD